MCIAARCCNAKWGKDVAKKSSNRRSKKPTTDKVEAVELPDEKVIEDAEIVDAASTEDTPDTVSEDTTETVSETTEEVAEVPEETVEAEVVPEETPVEIEEEKIEESKTYEVVAPPPPAPQKQNTFVPLVIGGLAAGLIGYGIASFQRVDNTDALSSAIASQADEIDGLRGDMTTLAERPQAVGVSAEDLAGVQSALDDLGNRIDSEIAALNERVTTVEKQPSSDGTLQEAAIAAYENDIADLRDQISVQQEELRNLLSETRQEAQSIEENAIASARSATARASLAIVQGALETGAPMGAALNDLDGATSDPVPDALMAAADGVASLGSLQADFPPLARAALATARSEGVSGEDSGGLTGFLRNQLDVRSVEPKDGDSTDAILSRAEGALSEGRLNDTLAELASLPEVARVELSEWIARAEQRAAALDAAATLASELNVN